MLILRSLWLSGEYGKHVADNATIFDLTIILKKWYHSILSFHFLTVIKTDPDFLLHAGVICLFHFAEKPPNTMLSKCAPHILHTQTTGLLPLPPQSLNHG